jgi:hypothetical protein
MEKPMAPDERDRSFDKALARHLRSTAPAREPAGQSEIPAPHGGACPDPETLAAYHERSLFSEQLNSLKEHIVGCANCQSVLAQLEATDEISLQASDQQEVSRKVSSPILSAGAATSKKSRRVLLMKGARWQWLAPAGALAAGLLVWIALHENRPFALPSLKEAQVATKQAPTSTAPPVARAEQDVSPAAKATSPKPPSAADELAAVNSRHASDPSKPNEKREYMAQASPSHSLADKEDRLRKDVERHSSDDLRRAEEQLDQDAKAAAGLRQENAEVQVQTQAANTQLQNQSNANSQKLPGPAPLGQMETKKARAASAAPVPPPPAPQPSAVGGATGGLASNYDGAVSVEAARAISNPRLIAPPSSTFLWRAGRGGLIELSKDSGSSWLRQTSGVLSDLLTGSAPSDQVCWIVGRGGAILLTTDGGAHWKSIHSPLTEDLGGVRATDALHTTIWNARATKSFQTSDGGLTWTPVPSP